MSFVGKSSYTAMLVNSAVADSEGDPRVPRIPPFSLAIVALLQLIIPASYLSVFGYCNLIQ